MLVQQFDVAKYDELLSRGLSCDIGNRDGQMCIEAVVCTVLGLPHGDDPQCVSAAVRRFKIALNDKAWSSPQARADGLRDLGLAQLGSKGVIGDVEFTKRLAEQTIRVLLPALFRDVLSKYPDCLAAADRCESEGSQAAARAAAAAAAAAYAADAAYAAAYAAYARAADAAYARAAAARAADAAYARAADAAAYAADVVYDAAYAAAYAAYARAADAAYARAAAARAADAAYARAADAADAADAAYAAAVYAAAAAAYAADAADARDKYLRLSASIAINVLREMGSPGCSLLINQEGESCYQPSA